MPYFNQGGLGGTVCLAIMPELDGVYDPENLGVLSVLALQEVAVGLLLAFVVILVFAVVTFAGHFIDTPIGFGMASVFDPALGGGRYPFFFAILLCLGRPNLSERRCPSMAFAGGTAFFCPNSLWRRD